MSDNIFHDHLDICQRCREQPSNLCPDGHVLLVKQATGQDIPRPVERSFLDTMDPQERAMFEDLKQAPGEIGALFKAFDVILGATR